MTERLRVVSQLGDADSLGIPANLRERVEVIPIRLKGDVPDDLVADALITVPRWSENLDEILSRGVTWVHLATTGVDGLDLDALGSGRILTNSRGASAIPISEWVLAVMLAFEKQLPEMWIDSPPEIWNAPTTLGTLSGRRLAIVGFGAIGRAIAERALPFGMEVRALRRTDGPSPHPQFEVVGSLHEVIDGADHIVIAAPLTDETRHLFNEEVFAQVKPGAHLVNISRGGLVDQDALRLALDNGTVARASLDAVDPEPLPADHWMFSHPLVRLSPHLSWSYPGAMDAIFDGFVENLRRRLDGLPLHNVVDPAVGY